MKIVHVSTEYKASSKDINMQDIPYKCKLTQMQLPLIQTYVK